MTPFTIPQGSQETLTVQFLEDGQTISIAGATVNLKVKADYNSSTTPIIDKDQTVHSAPLTGVTTFLLTDEDLATFGNYKYQLTVTYPDDSKPKTFVGDFIITRSL